MLDILIEAGCDINAQDKDLGKTPLMWALGGVEGTPGKLQVAEALVDKGADVNITDNLKHSAIMQAASVDNPTLLQKIIDKGGDVNAKADLLDAKFGAIVSAYKKTTIFYKWRIKNVKSNEEIGVFL